MNAEKEPNIILNEEEKRRLVAYFNVLIEMDLEIQKLHKQGIS